MLRLVSSTLKIPFSFKAFEPLSTSITQSHESSSRILNICILRYINQHSSGIHRLFNQEKIIFLKIDQYTQIKIHFEQIPPRPHPLLTASTSSVH